MARKRATKGHFFVSFHPDQLAEILKSHQNPEHYMALINKDRDFLIEVNAGGARDEISAHREINLGADIDKLEVFIFLPIRLGPSRGSL